MHRNMSQQRDISDRRRPLTDYRAELKSPYCRPTANQYDQDKRMRREIANSNERRRMQSINNGFTVLRKKLPNQHGEEKLSKANILQQTHEYINKLEEEIRSLTSQMKSPQNFRGPEGQQSRKRKSFDRNGGIRDEDMCSALIDEKLQLQYRLEEETEKCRKLMRRISELEKSIAAQSFNKSMSIAPGIEVRTVSSTGKVPPKQHGVQKVSHRISTATPLIGVSGVTSITAKGSKSDAIITQSMKSEPAVTSQSATIVRLRDSPEPPAKRATPLHGIHQLILAADHVENEGQVRTVSRVEPKVVGTAGGVVVSKQQQSEQATTPASGKSSHLQVLQFMTTSQSDGGTTKTGAAAGSTAAGGNGSGSTPTSLSSSAQRGSSGGNASGATSQLIQIVPAGQDIPPSAHVLHLVTGQTQRPRAGKVATHQEQKPSQQQPRPQQQREQSQQVLRIVPQVRLQSTGTAGGGKIEGGSAGNVLAMDQVTSKLNVADIGQQFTLYMRRSPGATTTQPVLGTAVSVSAASTTGSDSSTPAIQSVTSQALEPQSS